MILEKQGWILCTRQQQHTHTKKTSHQVCSHQGSPYGADVVTDRCVDPAAPCCVRAVCACLLFLMASWKCVDASAACTKSAVAVGSHAVIACLWK